MNRKAKLHKTVEDFLNGTCHKAGGQNQSGALHHDGVSCYSYARLMFTHVGQGKLRFHPGQSSATTSRHVNAVRSAAIARGFEILGGEK